MQKLLYDLNDLNLPLGEVFTNRPKKWNELINIKALVGAYLANLDRVFRGAFGQELQLEGSAEQYTLFKKIYPIIGKAMENSFGLRGFRGFCGKLAALRNTCMHAFSKVSKITESIDPTFMHYIPNWNHEHVQYVVDGDCLTLGGLFAILLCMGNKEMVSQIMASGISPLVRNVGLWRGYFDVRGKAYPEMMEQNLGNDLEQEIRTVPGSDLFSAIWGEYAFRIKGDASRFEYLSEKDNRQSIYHVRGFIEEGNVTRLHIDKNSYYHVYFAEHYALRIDDKDYFIECANKVPPFLFVAYLYRRGVKQFDRNSLSEDDLKLFPKLNKAKFYVDKNIHVILLGEAVSDQRMAHQCTAPQVLYAILNLEWNLRKAHREEVKRFYMYSTIKESLLLAGVGRDLVEDALFLRNFFAHGAILGDYIGKTDNTFRKIELSDCLDIFKRLALFLEEKGEYAASCLKQDIAQRLTEQLADMKYKALAKVWGGTIKGMPIDWIQYGKTMNRVSHSYVTPAIEEQLAWFKDGKCEKRYYVAEVPLSGKEVVLPTRQSAPEGLLTIVLHETEVDLQAFLGDASTCYEVTEQRENNLLSYRKYGQR